jgi:hypothetical protein
MRSTSVIAVGLVAAAAMLAGCGPKAAPAPTNSGTTGPTATPAVKALAPGNCTYFTNDDAATLIGSVNDTNPLVDINTAGGETIDLCFYGNLNIPGHSFQGFSYGIVKYDSDTTAQAKLQALEAEMLSDASEHDWPVTGLTLPNGGSLPPTGPVLGGYGTKTDNGLTYTLAVIGTNVGPYLVATIAGSTTDADTAKGYAQTVLATLISQAA